MIGEEGWDQGGWIGFEMVDEGGYLEIRLGWT